MLYEFTEFLVEEELQEVYQLRPDRVVMACLYTPTMISHAW